MRSMKKILLSLAFIFVIAIVSGLCFSFSNNLNETAKADGTFTITFNNGGTYNEDLEKYTFKDYENNTRVVVGNNNSVEVESGASFDLSSINPFYSPNGPTQIGWSLAPIGSEGYEYVIGLTDETPEVNDNITLYPYWEEIYYVRYYYYADDGTTGISHVQTKEAGEGITLRGLTYTNNSCVQIGWTTVKGSSTVEYGFSSSYSNNASLTLYPVWKLKEFTVKFKMSDPSIASINYTQLTLPYGSTISANGKILTIKSSKSNNPMTIAVNLAENTDTLSYSIDSWTNGNIVVTENVTITANVVAKQSSYSNISKQSDGTSIHIKAESDKGLIENALLQITSLEESKSNVNIKNKSANPLAYYELSFTKNGVSVKPDGEVTISFSVDKKTANKNNLVIYTLENGNLTEREVKVENGYVTFKTTDFCQFVLAEKTTQANYILIIAITVPSVIVFLTLVILFFAIKRKVVFSIGEQLVDSTSIKFGSEITFPAVDGDIVWFKNKKLTKPFIPVNAVKFKYHVYGIYEADLNKDLKDDKTEIQVEEKTEDISTKLSSILGPNTTNQEINEPVKKEIKQKNTGEKVEKKAEEKSELKETTQKKRGRPKKTVSQDKDLKIIFLSNKNELNSSSFCITIF